jgi:hypothetical protein
VSYVHRWVARALGPEARWRRHGRRGGGHGGSKPHQAGEGKTDGCSAVVSGGRWRQSGSEDSIMRRACVPARAAIWRLPSCRPLPILCSAHASPGSIGPGTQAAHPDSMWPEGAGAQDAAWRNPQNGFSLDTVRKQESGGRRREIYCWGFRPQRPSALTRHAVLSWAFHDSHWDSRRWCVAELGCPPPALAEVAAEATRARMSNRSAGYCLRWGARHIATYMEVPPRGD